MVIDVHHIKVCGSLCLNRCCHKRNTIISNLLASTEHVGSYSRKWFHSHESISIHSSIYSADTKWSLKQETAGLRIHTSSSEKIAGIPGKITFTVIYDVILPWGREPMVIKFSRSRTSFYFHLPNKFRDSRFSECRDINGDGRICSHPHSQIIRLNSYAYKNRVKLTFMKNASVCNMLGIFVSLRHLMSFKPMHDETNVTKTKMPWH